MLTLYRNDPLLFFAAILGSVLLSMWSIYADPIVNDDGILYITTAKEFVNGNWQQGFDLYRWPFYPLLIAFVSKVLPIGTENAAYFVNIAFNALLCLGFVCVVRELGGGKRVILFATLLILFFPSISKYRPFIIRDTGYLACYIWSLYYIFRYLNTHHAGNLIAWLACILTCMLFRIEGIAFLCIVPLIILLTRLKKPAHKTITTLSIATALILLTISLTMWLFSNEISISFTLKEQPIAYMQEVWFHLKQQIDFRLLAIEQEFLGEFSKNYAKTVLLITLVVMISYETLRRLAFVYALMAWHALKRKLVLTDKNQYKLWVGLILTHIVILCAFTFGKMFVVSRYTMALVLTILLLAPFSANYFWQQWRNKETSTARWLVPLFIIVFCLSSIKGLDRWSEKLHLRKAGQWAAENIETDARIYTNQRTFLYYADRESIRTQLQHTWPEAMKMLRSKTLSSDFDYMAIQFSASRSDQKQRFESRLQREAVKSFDNGKGNLLVIYKL